MADTLSNHRSSAAVTVFRDTFDADTLNRDLWTVIGPTFWVNNEQQAYIDSNDTIRIRPAGSVKGATGGVLELWAHYRPGFKTPSGRVCDFISGRIETQHKFACQYGRISARIRMPAAKGIWPAFWMLGDGPWPDIGEIDILEYVGERDWVGAAAHGPGYSGDYGFVNKYYFPEGQDATDWHVYAVEWDCDQMNFFVDDQLIYRLTRPMIDFFGEWVFDNPKHLILNLAIGGVYPFKTNGVTEPYYGLPKETFERIRDEGMAVQIDWVEVTQPAE